jgi:hypothetical protein
MISCLIVDFMLRYNRIFLEFQPNHLGVTSQSRKNNEDCRASAPKEHAPGICPRGRGLPQSLRLLRNDPSGVSLIYWPSWGWGLAMTTILTLSPFVAAIFNCSFCPIFSCIPSRKLTAPKWFHWRSMTATVSGCRVRASVLLAGVSDCALISSWQLLGRSKSVLTSTC